MVPAIAEKRAELAELCRRHHVRRLDLFGSAARGDGFTDASDVDLVVASEPDHVPTWKPFFEMRDALAALFGRSVDLVSDAAVRNPYLRADIDRIRGPLHGA